MKLRFSNTGQVQFAQITRKFLLSALHPSYQLLLTHIRPFLSLLLLLINMSSASLLHIHGLISYILLILYLLSVLFYSSSTSLLQVMCILSHQLHLLLFSLLSAIFYSSSFWYQLLFCTSCASISFILLLFGLPSAFFYSPSSCHQLLFCTSCWSYQLHFTHSRPLYSILLLLIILVSALHILCVYQLHFTPIRPQFIMSSASLLHTLLVLSA